MQADGRQLRLGMLQAALDLDNFCRESLVHSLQLLMLLSLATAELVCGRRLLETLVRHGLDVGVLVCTFPKLR